MADDNEHLFMCLWAICTCSLEKSSQFSFNLRVLTSRICFSNIWDVSLGAGALSSPFYSYHTESSALWGLDSKGRLWD